MTRHRLGWSLPPGVSHLPYDGPAICEVCCGDADADQCICAECPVCHVSGDPNCYRKHGMKLTHAQAVRRAEVRVAHAKDMLQSEELALAQLIADKDLDRWSSEIEDNQLPWEMKR